MSEPLPEDLREMGTVGGLTGLPAFAAVAEPMERRSGAVLLHGALEVAVTGPAEFLDAVGEQFWPHALFIARRDDQTEVDLVVGTVRPDLVDAFPQETTTLLASPDGRVPDFEEGIRVRWLGLESAPGPRPDPVVRRFLRLSYPYQAAQDALAALRQMLRHEGPGQANRKHDDPHASVLRFEQLVDELLARVAGAEALAIQAAEDAQTGRRIGSRVTGHY